MGFAGVIRIRPLYSRAGLAGVYAPWLAFGQESNAPENRDKLKLTETN